ncbi:GDP-mannose pyrophosphatase NudK [Dyella psychrodurans]|uniref:GDP-mannose pyrophosphatase n=1 Tax=Dyella psychrodurans TaxID=1927960 RepID=A0A370X2Y5_9GAMM|nr:GDP-mannose pyrophosphatase NudK [Dyella psychrodurans]RDS82611.1 GDP-mannose pyrophosphatase NudK [Dyella psychrodurans]
MSERIRNIKEQLLSDNWYVLKKATFDFQRRNGTWETTSREAYDRGNGATILLYNTTRNGVILTRQFRYPTFVNGNLDGMLIEACAGLLDNDDPETCIRRETEEETGYIIDSVRKVFEAYMSPGSVTEKLFFFVGEYSERNQTSDGGGVDSEDIEVLELDFAQAMAMVEGGEIRDGKTIMLLQYAKLAGLLK